MPDTREHLAFPLRLGPGGFLVTVDQDSDAEIAGCMATILLWPQGTRELDPEFGLPDQSFLDGGADLDEIREALLTQEPRAIESVVQDDRELANFVSAVRVTWDRSTGRPQ